jgi:hypothetical protein
MKRWKIATTKAGSKDLLCLYLNNNEDSQLFMEKKQLWWRCPNTKTTILFGDSADLN